MRLATWNVNSIKARLDAALAWLDEGGPDVLALQEIKCVEDAFPRLEFEAKGYEVLIAGQKSYNGVALVSKLPMEDPLVGLAGDASDEQARYVEATVAGVRVASIYLPNGNPVGTEKFSYKLAWMDRLRARAAELTQSGRPVALMGDFNVIPTPEDCYDPKAWEGDALFQPETIAQFRALCWLGYYDAFRTAKPHAPAAYTFWTIRAAPGRRTTASASTTSCCRPPRSTAWSTSTSIGGRAGGRRPPTILLCGAISRTRRWRPGSCRADRRAPPECPSCRSMTTIRGAGSEPPMSAGR